MIFHGTDANNIEDILKNGIRPWNEFREQTNWTEIPTHKDMVYLSDVYALYYAEAATNETNDIALFEIDETKLDQQSIFPDEDFIAQVFLDAKNIGEEIPLVFSACDSIIKITELIEPRDYRPMTTACRLNYGNLAYNGTIPPSAITRYRRYSFEAHDMLYFIVSDPCVSPMNFRLVGERYRSLCDFVIRGLTHPLADITVQQYLGMPSVFIQSGPAQLERVDGKTRAEMCERRGVSENRKIADEHTIIAYYEDVKKWNKRATAIYETVNAGRANPERLADE